MNLPNKLSLLRIILIPVTMLFMLPISIYGFEPQGWNNFVQSYGMIIAGFVFIIASLTDMLDGKIARKYNLITDLGKFLDSLADKMLVIAVLIAFVGSSPINSSILRLRKSTGSFGFCSHRDKRALLITSYILSSSFGNDIFI